MFLELKGRSRNWRCIRQAFRNWTETGFLAFGLVIRNVALSNLMTLQRGSQDYVKLRRRRCVIIVVSIRSEVNGPPTVPGNSPRRSQRARRPEVRRLLLQ